MLDLIFMYALFSMVLVWSSYESVVFFSKDLLSTCSLMGQTNLNLIADDLFSQTAFWFSFAISLRGFFILIVLYYSSWWHRPIMQVSLSQ